MKKLKNFRLSEEGVADLGWLAQHLRRSETSVVEELLRDRAELERGDATMARLAELEQRVAELERREGSE